MKRVLLLALAAAGALSLAACSRSASVAPGGNPALVHHSDDAKGQNVFPETRPATGKRVFIFDPKDTAWAAYDENGHRVKTGRASGGNSWCEDIGRACKTAVGKFTVYAKKGEECQSSRYPLETNGGSPMPHCMHFYKGYAIHGAYHVPDYNASHGCIRVTPSAAQWLNNDFMRVGTTVIVEPYGHSF